MTLLTVKDEQDAWVVRLFLIGYCAFAWGSTSIYAAADLYARSIDPWLNSRRSPSMILFQDVQQIHWCIAGLLIIFSPCVLVMASTWKTRVVLIVHCLVVLASCNW